MVFESPIWLLGLLPWVALVLYLLPGKTRPEAVTFLFLWKETRNASRGRARRLPPASTLLILLSLLLAVLAAGKPGIVSKGAANQSITIILDRGASMALPSISGKPFRGAIEKCKQQIGPVSDSTRVTLINLPGERVETTGEQWVSLANGISPTVVPTQISQAIANQLHENGNRVYVLSGQLVDRVDERVTQITPEKAEECVAITAIGARSLPRPQVFVRLENHSTRATINLRVKSGTTIVEREVTLAAFGRSVDAFVDLPALNETVMAEIDSDPSRNPWAHAWMVRQNAGIKLIQVGQLPTAVQRMVNIYGADRPSADSSQPVVISGGALSLNQAGIWIDATASDKVAGSLVVESDALTRNIKHWPTAFGDHAPPEGFTSIISSANRVLLGKRESPARQIWFNGNLESWQDTTDFVIFFANAFEWLDGEPIYTTIESGQPDKPWPGIYGSTAINAGKFPTANPVQKQDGGASIAQAVSRKSISSGILLSALSCLVLAIILRNR